MILSSGPSEVCQHRKEAEGTAERVQEQAGHLVVESVGEIRQEINFFNFDLLKNLIFFFKNRKQTFKFEIMNYFVIILFIIFTLETPQLEQNYLSHQFTSTHLVLFLTIILFYLFHPYNVYFKMFDVRRVKSVPTGVRIALTKSCNKLKSKIFYSNLPRDF